MAEYRSKYTGAEVDALLDKVNEGEAIMVDSSLSTTSENPVMNKVITEEFEKKANVTDLETPDWNALSGDSGYIKNKTHSLINRHGSIFDVNTPIPASVDTIYAAIRNSIYPIPPMQEGERVRIVGGPPVYVECKLDISRLMYYLIDDYGYFASGLTVFYGVSMLPDIFIPATIARVSDLEKGIAGLVTPILYADLVALRNEGKLKAGMFYRITDYVTTTAQENTRSAGHQFDVIVTADNKNTLNEVARACLHEGDTYFSEAGANLAAWKVWYCLDNDSERFAWACEKAISNGEIFFIRMPQNDVVHNGVQYYAWKGISMDAPVAFSVSQSPAINETMYDDSFEEDWEVVEMIQGKGVIYRLIDEWNNDCPYDFKNIQFKRNLTFDEGYAKFSEDGVETWVYTFAGQSYHVNNDDYSDMLDGSLESPYGHMSDEGTSTFHDNIIKPYIMVYNGNDVYTECGIRYLNDNVVLGYWEEIGSANEEDAPYYFASCCHNNSFGNNCHNNSFGSDCYNNSFGSDCYNNSFGDNCHNNSFGYSCHNNSFGYSCSNNSFGSDCYNNSLYEVLNTTILSGVANKKNIDQSYVMVATNSQGEVKVFNIADLVE